MAHLPDQTEITGNFQCPVCRARQALQSRCRRCHADLSLVVAARERIVYLLKEHAARKDSELEQKAITEEIRLLAPRLLSP